MFDLFLLSALQITHSFTLRQLYPVQTDPGVKWVRICVALWKRQNDLVLAGYRTPVTRLQRNCLVTTHPAVLRLTLLENEGVGLRRDVQNTVNVLLQLRLAGLVDIVQSGWCFSP